MCFLLAVALLGSASTVDVEDEEFDELLDKLDMNKDGRLSLAEVKDRMLLGMKGDSGMDHLPLPVLSLVDESDADNNGFLERAELPHMIAGMKGALERSGLPPIPDDDDDDEAEPMPKVTEAQMEAMLREIDTDKDGKLSLAEITSRMSSDFKEQYGQDAPKSLVKLLEDSDADKNGHLDPDEARHVLEGMEAALKEDFAPHESTSLLEEEDEEPEDVDLSEVGDLVDRAEAEKHLEAEKLPTPPPDVYTVDAFHNLLKEMDADKDGKLSLAELDHAMASDFKKAFDRDIPVPMLSVLERGDANHNGYIEEGEVPQVMSDMEAFMVEHGLDGDAAFVEEHGG